MNYLLGIFILLSASTGFSYESIQQCGKEKIYLEGYIADFLADYYREVSSNIIRPSFLSHLRQAIAASQELAPLTSFAQKYPRIFYVHCPDKRESEYRERPCLTQNYTLSMATIFRDVTTCAGVDPEEFFAIIDREGRFQANIANRSNIYCAGQISDIAIKEIHRLFNTKNPSFRDLIFKDFTPNYQKPLELSSFQGLFSSSKCKAFKKFAPIPYSSLSPCEKVAFPQGSYLCLMYSALYYRYLKDNVEKKIFNGKHSTRASLGEIKDMVYQLTLYAYNGGVSEIMDIWASFLARNELSIKTFRDFRTYLAKNYYRTQLTEIKYALEIGSKAKLTQVVLGHSLLAPLASSIDRQFYSCRKMVRENSLENCHNIRGLPHYGVCDVICKIKWKRAEIIDYADRVLESRKSNF